MRASGRRWAWILWACFLARASFYAVLPPLWEGFDEWAHVAYIERLACGQGLPALGRTPVSREVAESLRLVPLPYGHHALPFEHITYEQWWRLAAAERQARIERLDALPRAWACQQSPEAVLNYEAQQPPLYYLMLTPVQRVAGGLPLRWRVVIMRLLSALLASFAIPLTYELARRARCSETCSAAAAALAALLPGFGMTAARVGNDGVSASIYALLLLAVVSNGPSLAAGFALGAGLLTKAYFLTAAPALALAWIGRLRSKRGILSMAAAFGAAAVIAAWWYGRNYLLTRTWSGLQQVAANPDASLSSTLAAASSVDWLGFFDIAFLSHIWIGNWSFLQLRSWIYRVFALLAAAALAGLMARLWRERRLCAGLLQAAGFYIFFWLGLCYHELTFRAVGASSGAGWYLYALVAAEALLVAAGLEALAGRSRGWLLAGTLGLAAALDLYGVHFQLLPYYTGLIGHRTGGAVESFHLSRFTELPLALERLMAPAPVSWFLWAAYLAATVAAFWLASRAFRVD